MKPFGQAHALPFGLAAGSNFTFDLSHPCNKTGPAQAQCQSDKGISALYPLDAYVPGGPLRTLFLECLMGSSRGETHLLQASIGQLPGRLESHHPIYATVP